MKWRLTDPARIPLEPEGFNGPSRWRSLSLFCLPGLPALSFLLVFVLTLQVSSAIVVALAVLFALFNGLSKEARFRGVMQRAARSEALRSFSRR